MINNVTLLGRITHDLEVKNTPSGIAVLTFTVAVDRGYKKDREEPQTDFIRCVAWAKKAIMIAKYFKKGSMIGLVGNLQSRTYDDKNGVKHYITEVIVEKASFTGERSKKASASTANNSQDSENTQNNNQNVSEYIGDISDFEVVITDEGVPFMD